MNKLWLKIRSRAQRDASRFFARRVASITPARGIVSFTFDDFPVSAVHEGGAILRKHGYFGTYYASFGLMGKTAPTGRIFTCDDLKEVMRQGHEIGCHTFDHCHSWNTSPEEFESSVLRNRRAAVELLPGIELRSLSYPISGPRPQTKRRVEKYYECARGGGQTFNKRSADLNFLKAFFIEQSVDDFDAIERTIQANARERGWLIFATHDVCASPTRFGCTPEFLKRVVECVAKSGAAVLPVHQAWRCIRIASSN